MKVGKLWKVESDSLNVTLYRKKKRTRKDTQEVYEDWDALGYFGTVGGALQELINQGVRDTHLTEVQSVVRKIEEIHNLIRKLEYARK